MNKTKPKVELYFSLILFLVTFFIVYVQFSPIFFGLNDDGTLVNLINGTYVRNPSKSQIYTSEIYAHIMSSLYQHFPLFQWHGIYLFLTVLVSFLILIRCTVENDNRKFLTTIGIFLVLFNLYLIFIITPTFTMAALISGFSALIVFYKNLIYGKRQILLPAVLLLNSFMIRPDGFLAVIYFLVPGIIYLSYSIYKGERSIGWNLIIILPTVVIYVFDLFEKMLLRKSSTEWNNYWQFLNNFHLVDTNPSMLKMHQAVASFQIPGLKWTNVEATLLHSIAYLDPEIFTVSQMEMAKNHVRDYIGIRALFNYEFIPTIQRIWEFMSPINYIFFALVAIFAIYTLLGRRYIYLFYISAIFYIFSFYYYLAAAWRIPPRINIPILFMIGIGILILNSYSKIYSFKLNLIAIYTFLAFIIVAQFQITGLKGAAEKLSQRQIEVHAISDELRRVDRNGIFIGEIAYANESYTNAFLNRIDYKTLDLATGWQVFSPPWLAKVRDLGNEDGNPIPSLVYGENTYWVSDQYIGEVMAMYLNDRKLNAKGICNLGKLPNGGVVFSFQLTNKECNNRRN